MTCFLTRLYPGESHINENVCSCPSNSSTAQGMVGVEEEGGEKEEGNWRKEERKERDKHDTFG